MLVSVEAALFASKKEIHVERQTYIQRKEIHVGLVLAALEAYDSNINMSRVSFTDCNPY